MRRSQQISPLKANELLNRAEAATVPTEF